jgi:Ca2+-binding RTX toxin-like protein
MATYSFSTITDAQAAALTASDSFSFDQGTATDATVLYASPTEIDIILGGRTVAFSAAIAALSQANHLTFPDGTTLVIGDGGDNKISGVTAAFGGAGDDTISGGGVGAALIQGNGGNDSVSAFGGGFATIYGGQGNDSIIIASGSFGQPSAPGHNFVQGNKGDDTIFALGNAFDTILGGQGDDIIQDEVGTNFLNGNLGNDTIISFGNDQVFGEGGDDSIQGRGAATVHGGDGGDVLTGGSFVFGDAGNDTVSAGFSSAVQTIDGGDGDDLVKGVLFGSSVLIGGLGNDTIGDLTGPDTMEGDAGDDRIVSNNGNALIQGGDGDDTIVAVGPGNVMSGGPGADRFELSQGTLTSTGIDKITDWSAQDVIHFANYPNAPLALSTASAADFAGALAAATQVISAHPAVVAVQVGAEVIVFAAGANNQVDVAVDLVGRSLADITVGDIV